MCLLHSFRPVHHNKLNYFPEGETRKVTLVQLAALQNYMWDEVLRKGDGAARLKEFGRIIQEIREQKA